MAEWLGGVHPVREALAGVNRAVHEVWIRGPASTAALEGVAEAARSREVEVRHVDRSTFDGLQLEGAQRVAAKCSPFRYRGEADLPPADPDRWPCFIVVLDHLKDPQNVGAIVRTAEVAGARAVCLPRRRAVGITPAVVRASAGATEHLPVHAVGNVARTVGLLGERGYWSVGLDPEATASWDEVEYDRGIALVVGSEGKGLHRLVGDRCDHTVALPAFGRVASLNASAAFAAMTYEVLRQQVRAGAPGVRFDR